MLPAVKGTLEVVQKFPFEIHFTKGTYRDIAFVFHKKTVTVFHRGIDLRSFSFVWLSSNWETRDLAYAVHLYLISVKTPHSYVEEGSSKITDCMFFGLHNLPMPDTVFVNRSQILKNLSLIKDVCGYPLIIKDIKGAQGKYSEFVTSELELLEKISLLPKDRKFLFQRYIPNEYDWGIMMANGEVVAGEKSYPLDGEFRNNSCNGAKEHFIEISAIPRKIKEIALATNNLLGLSWCRVDIIVDKKTNLPYLLEINRFPGITSASNEVLGAYTFLASHIFPNKKKI